MGKRGAIQEIMRFRTIETPLLITLLITMKRPSENTIECRHKTATERNHLFILITFWKRLN